MLILASNSPRRHELLKLLRLPFKIQSSEAEEISRDFSENPTQIAIENAKLKAIDVSKNFPDDTIIGADTIVTLGTKIFGKPHGRDGAVAMLEELQNRTHEVITGLAIVDAGNVFTDAEKTLVTFGEMTRGEIESFVDTGEPMDKSGSYALQGFTAPFIQKIDGDWSNVVGLPLYRLRIMLNKIWHEEEDF